MGMVRTEDDSETSSDSETTNQKLAILKLQSVPIQKLTRFRNNRVSRFRNSLDSETGRLRNNPIQKRGGGVGI